MDEMNDVSVDAGAEIPDTGAADTSESTLSDSDVHVVVDKATGERTVEFGKVNDTSDTPAKENAAESDTDAQNNIPADNQPNYYTDTELIQALGSGNVDFSRMSEAQANSFNAYRQREIAMQEAERNRMIQAEQAKTQMARTRRANLYQIADKAKQMALQQFGITEADIPNLEFMEGGEEKLKAFNDAYSNNFANLQYQMVENEIRQQMRVQEYQRGMEEIANFVKSEAATEPHHAEILQLMDTAKKTMPWEQAVRIDQTERNISSGICTPNDLNVIRQFYDECKKQVYQNKANVSKVPQRTSVPKVEKAGVPNVQSSPAPNFGNWRGMTQHQRDAAALSYISGRV